MIKCLLFVLVSHSFFICSSAIICWNGAKFDNNYFLSKEKLCSSCFNITFNSGLQVFFCDETSFCSKKQSNKCAQEKLKIEDFEFVKNQIGKYGWRRNLVERRARFCCCQGQKYCSYNPPHQRIDCYRHAEMDHENFKLDKRTRTEKGMSCMVMKFDSGLVVRNRYIGTSGFSGLCGGDTKQIDLTGMQRVIVRLDVDGFYKNKVTRRASIHCCNTDRCNQGYKVGMNIGLLSAALLTLVQHVIRS